MCLPAIPAGVLAGMQIASTAAALIGQAQASRATSAANRVQAANARSAQVENAGQVGLRRQQEADAAGQSINANNTALREAQSSVVAQAGPSGLSMEALLGSLAAKGATYNESVNANLVNTNMALDNQLSNVNRNAASEINSLRAPAPVDYLGAALKIGNTANNAGFFNGATPAPGGNENRPNRGGR